jgi:hypothetical protein
VKNITVLLPGHGYTLKEHINFNVTNINRKHLSIDGHGYTYKEHIRLNDRKKTVHISPYLVHRDAPPAQL